MLRITLTSLVVAVALVLAFGPLVQAQQPPQPPPRTTSICSMPSISMRPQ